MVTCWPRIIFGFLLGYSALLTWNPHGLISHLAPVGQVWQAGFWVKLLWILSAWSRSILDQFLVLWTSPVLPCKVRDVSPPAVPPRVRWSPPGSCAWLGTSQPEVCRPVHAPWLLALLCGAQFVIKMVFLFICLDKESDWPGFH